MRLKGVIFGAVLATLGAAAVVAPAAAHNHRHHGGGYGYRDYHRSPRVSFDVWVGGSWRHDWYDGRYGWWWVTGPDWYYYPRPIYPYPAYDYVVVQPPAPSGPPPAQYWYYCDSPKGYYPYVPQCSTAWRAVPATPPGPVQ